MRIGLFRRTGFVGLFGRGGWFVWRDCCCIFLFSFACFRERAGRLVGFIARGRNGAMVRRGRIKSWPRLRLPRWPDAFWRRRAIALSGIPNRPPGCVLGRGPDTRMRPGFGRDGGVCRGRLLRRRRARRAVLRMCKWRFRRDRFWAIRYADFGIAGVCISQNFAVSRR